MIFIFLSSYFNRKSWNYDLIPDFYGFSLILDALQPPLAGDRLYFGLGVTKRQTLRGTAAV